MTTTRALVRYPCSPASRQRLSSSQVVSVGTRLWVPNRSHMDLLARCEGLDSFMVTGRSLAGERVHLNYEHQLMSSLLPYRSRQQQLMKMPDASVKQK